MIWWRMGTLHKLPMTPPTDHPHHAGEGPQKLVPLGYQRSLPNRDRHVRDPIQSDPIQAIHFRFFPAREQHHNTKHQTLLYTELLETVAGHYKYVASITTQSGGRDYVRRETFHPATAELGSKRNAKPP